MTGRRWALVATVVAVATILAMGLFPRPSESAADGAGTVASPASAASTTLASASVTPDSGPAAGALRSFNKAFLMIANGAGYYRLGTTGGQVTFFRQVELMEVTEDAFERSGDPAYKRAFGVLYKGLVAHHGSGSSWLRKTNDDLMWATIMCLRAYRMTGDRAYLRQAKATFDAMYARAWSTDLGGGLWNSTRRRTKNACVVAPAVIASSMLYKTLHDVSYLRKAKRLYGWLRSTLYDAGTGAVYDHVSPGDGDGDMVLDRTTWTYNQGVLIGAADQLYRITKDRAYYDDAVRTLDFTKDNLTIDGILRREVSVTGSLSDCAGGFKGMFVRWAAAFIRHNRVEGYDEWFQRNVTAVRSNRNAAGLMDEDWSSQTWTGTLSAFSTSSAVVLLQWYPPVVEPAVAPSG